MLNVLKKIAKLATVSIVGLYSLIWALSPFAANHFLSEYLETQNLELDTKSTIRYNPFLSKLTIEDLSVTTAANKSEIVLALSNFILSFSAYQLLFEKIRISEFFIDGLYLTVNKEADLLSVAGIRIPIVDGTRSQNIEVVEPGAIDLEAINSNAGIQTSNLHFQLVMPKMALMNSMIDIVEEGQQHQLQLSDININEVKATQSMQSLSLTLVGDLDGAEITLSAVAAMKEGLGDIDIEVALADVDINKFSHLAAPHVETIAGLVSYNARHKIELTTAGISLDITNLAFKSQNLEATKNGLQLTLGEQALKSELLSLRTSADTALSITADGELLLKDFNIYNKTKAQVLLAMKETALNNVDISSGHGQYRVTVNSIAILDSFFSDNVENEVPALTQFSSLNINDTVLTNNALAINTIELAGLKASAQLDEDKLVKNLIMSMAELSAALKQGGKSETEAVSKNENKNENKNESIEAAATEKIVALEETQFAIKLNSFNLTDSAGIQFSDASVSPRYNRYITVTQLSAGPFYSQRPSQNSIIKIKGTSNKYASFDVNVNAKPFLETPTYQLEGQLNEIDLPGLSSYIKPALGYEIKSGHLDLGINVKFTGTKMDGESQVLLRGINLSVVDRPNESLSKIQTSIPFNVALSMLEDGDGNVELSLPLSGDINGPSFGLSGFLTLLVKQATIIGAREYLAVTLFPYAGLVTVVILADKHMLKVQINDLDYSSTETDVPIDNDVFLSEFAALMNDKSDLQIKLCGVSSATDIGKAKGSDISNKEDIEILRAISKQRAINFKAYMVEEKKVDSSRLLLCKPQIDSSEDAIPHLRFET